MCLVFVFVVEIVSFLSDEQNTRSKICTNLQNFGLGDDGGDGGYDVLLVVVCGSPIASGISKKFCSKPSNISTIFASFVWQFSDTKLEQTSPKQSTTKKNNWQRRLCMRNVSVDIYTCVGGIAWAFVELRDVHHDGH